MTTGFDNREVFLRHNKDPRVKKACDYHKDRIARNIMELGIVLLELGTCFDEKLEDVSNKTLRFCDEDSLLKLFELRYSNKLSTLLISMLTPHDIPSFSALKLLLTSSRSPAVPEKKFGLIFTQIVWPGSIAHK